MPPVPQKDWGQGLGWLPAGIPEESARSPELQRLEASFTPRPLPAAFSPAPEGSFILAGQSPGALHSPVLL